MTANAEVTVLVAIPATAPAVSTVVALSVVDAA